MERSTGYIHYSVILTQSIQVCESCSCTVLSHLLTVGVHHVLMHEADVSD
jgi:hypothetical protein